MVDVSAYCISGNHKHIVDNNIFITALLISIIFSKKVRGYLPGFQDDNCSLFCHFFLNRLRIVIRPKSTFDFQGPSEVLK